jgi:hypothetical protein
MEFTWPQLWDGLQQLGGIVWQQVGTFLQGQDAARTIFALLAGLISVSAALLRFITDRSVLYQTISPNFPIDLSDDGRRLYWALDGDAQERRLTVWSIRIGNRGRLPIKRDQFDSGQPLELMFPNGPVKHVEVGERVPTKLHLDVSDLNPENETSIKISPLLLNSGDEVELKVILDGDYRALSGFTKWMLEPLRSLGDRYNWPQYNIRIEGVTGIKKPSIRTRYRALQRHYESLRRLQGMANFVVRYIAIFSIAYLYLFILSALLSSSGPNDPTVRLFNEVVSWVPVGLAVYLALFLIAAGLRFALEVWGARRQRERKNRDDVREHRPRR